MPRTTDELVAGVIEVDDTIPITPFISAANTLVTEYCTGSNGPAVAYDDDRLQQIETWLAAHFYAHRDMRAIVERVDTVWNSFQYQNGLGFDNTMYGQTAMRLDTNGRLAAANQQAKNGRGRKVGVTWLGTDRNNE